MNKIKILLCMTIPFLMFITENCNKKTDNGTIDFLNDQDRIGIWVNQSRNDTLEIKSNDLLIRHFGNTIEYNYRIQNSTLYLLLPNNTDTETQHMITEVGNADVTIQNMYIGIEFTDNSGVFKKIQ